MDAVSTTDAPSVSFGRAAKVSVAAAVRLTASTRANTSGAYSSRSRLRPAQCTSRSIRSSPPSSAATPAGSVTSNSCSSIPEVDGACGPPASNPAACTDAPRAANRLATAAPMPEVPPVTSATAPVNSPSVKVISRLRRAAHQRLHAVRAVSGLLVEHLRGVRQVDDLAHHRREVQPAGPDQRHQLRVAVAVADAGRHPLLGVDHLERR